MPCQIRRPIPWQNQVLLMISKISDIIKFMPLRTTWVLYCAKSDLRFVSCQLLKRFVSSAKAWVSKERYGEPFSIDPWSLWLPFTLGFQFTNFGFQFRSRLFFCPELEPVDVFEHRNDFLSNRRTNTRSNPEYIVSFVWIGRLNLRMCQWFRDGTELGNRSSRDVQLASKLFYVLHQ